MIDEASHFVLLTRAPTVFEFEGTFMAPDRVKGIATSPETTGLPGCEHRVVSFFAHPRSG